MVVVFAGTAWSGNMFPDQHIAGRLARYAPVLYVDPPVSPVSRWRNPAAEAALAGPRLRLVAPSLARLTPVVPPGVSRPGLRQAATWLTRRSARAAVRRLGGRVHAVVAATLTDAFGALGESRRVLYATDDFVAGAELMGVSAGWLLRQQDRVLAEVDTVVTVSATLTADWQARGAQVVQIPNGVDAELFAGTDRAPWPDDVDLPRPVVGFVGHLSERIDLAVLEAVADRGHSLLLVGPRQMTFDLARMDALLARPNVCWVGAKPFDRLPSYLRVMDVGLLPYADSAFNRASFPLKVLEYLAAGRPAVATDLPAVRWLDTDLIAVGRDPAGVAAAVDRVLAAPPDPALVERRRRFAAEHSWDRRAAQFAEVLGLDATPTPTSA